MSFVVTACRHATGDRPADSPARLQRFVACLDEQCRQTGLDAELIVVDWNPPPEQAALAALLRLSDLSFCTHRFIEVPPEFHNRLRHADVLPAFPMIARNAGLRRAHGQFVVATSVDVVFPTALIAYLASRQLESNRLYRVDRHDVDPDVPNGASLDTVLHYCVTHQRQVHGRGGPYPINADGSSAPLDEDIVNGRTVRLGDGWHVREGDSRTGFFRWAGARADFIVDSDGSRPTRTLTVDIEVNPSDPRAWVTLDAMVGERVLSRRHVNGRMQLRVPLEEVDMSAPCRVELRVAASYAKARFGLPLFERRDEMLYRAHSAEISDVAADASMVTYPFSGWTNADPQSEQTVAPSTDGLMVETSAGQWLYSMHYHVQAPDSGRHRFDLTCSVLAGRVLVGVLNGRRTGWLPASVTVRREGNRQRFGISVDLRRHESCWLTISNDHPEGTGVSRFIIHRMTGSIDPDWLARSRTSSFPASRVVGRALAMVAGTAAHVTRVLAAARPPHGWNERLSEFAKSAARLIVAALPDRVRGRVVRAAPEYRVLEHAFRVADDQARMLLPLQALSALATSLRRHRPDHLHVNACGDFQLMAREHWQELQGYFELEGFSYQVDSLLSFTAAAAGIKEEMLAMPIYYAPPPVLSSPAHEDLTMRRRMAARAVPALDAGTVSIWASQMRWLQRPFTFNGADWGLNGVELREHTTKSTNGPTH